MILLTTYLCSLHSLKTDIKNRFSFGLVKTESGFIVRSVETGLGR